MSSRTHSGEASDCKCVNFALLVCVQVAIKLIVSMEHFTSFDGLLEDLKIHFREWGSNSRLLTLVSTEALLGFNPLPDLRY